MHFRWTICANIHSVFSITFRTLIPISSFPPINIRFATIFPDISLISITTLHFTRHPVWKCLIRHWSETNQINWLVSDQFFGHLIGVWSGRLRPFSWDYFRLLMIFKAKHFEFNLHRGGGGGGGAYQWCFRTVRANFVPHSRHVSLSAHGGTSDNWFNKLKTRFTRKENNTQNDIN